MTIVRNAVAALLGALVLAFIVLHCAQGAGLITTSGIQFDVRSGAIQAVTPGSAAALAGVRPGDSADFERGGWQLHLSLNRMGLISGQRLPLPLVRQGRPFTAMLVGAPPSLPANAWTHFVTALMSVVYFALGLTLFLLRRSPASFAFCLFAAGTAAAVADNLIWTLVTPQAYMPIAMLLAGIGPALTIYGVLYFAIVFANSSARMEFARRWLIVPYMLTAIVLYEYHFYGNTIGPQTFNTYSVATALFSMSWVIAAVSITARANRDPAMASRLRWVAVAIWAETVLSALFFIDQNLPSHVSGTTDAVDLIYGWFKPAIFGIAYILLRTRVIDVRVAGARTLVYGVLTAIPIGLFAVADWFFSRKLADARMATVVEFAVAVFFGIWLNTLHKRIDRFVERIVFAARHHAFQRIRHAIHALTSAERSETPIDMLCEEAAGALLIASAAVFIERGGVYERAQALGWDDAALELQADDPLVLFARSQGRAVRLTDVAPSGSTLPHGDAAPEIALPINVNHQTVGVVLYGKHATGEHLDADEEELLSELSHAAGAALQRLQSLERVRELEAIMRVVQPAPGA